MGTVTNWRTAFLGLKGVAEAQLQLIAALWKQSLTLPAIFFFPIKPRNLDFSVKSVILNIGSCGKEKNLFQISTIRS